MKLEFIRLPDNYTTLLKSDFWPGHPTYRTSVNYILEQNDLFYRYRNIWPNDLAFNELFASLGWPLFREKLAYTFLSEVNSDINEFSHKDMIDKYRKLEQDFVDITTSGHSRLFLINFYFLMLGLDPFKEIDYPIILNIFKHLKKKVTRIDWLVLIAQSFLNFYDENTLIEAVSNDKGYTFLIKNLASDQLEELNEIIFSYASSVNDLAFFEDFSKDFV